MECPECDWLWKAYALANRKHLDAILAREGAAQAGDVERLKILEDEAYEAAQWWALARKAVREHAAIHAGEKPERQDEF
jgi:hypothetical protein